MIHYFCDTFLKSGDGEKLSPARMILVTGEKKKKISGHYKDAPFP